MESIKRDFREHKKPILIGLITLIFFGFILYYDWSDTPERTPVIGGRKTLIGNFTCLPERGGFFGGDECSLGILERDGNNYGIDTQLVTKATPDLSGGDEIIIKGLLVPIEEISSKEWTKYDIAGVIQAESIERY